MRPFLLKAGLMLVCYQPRAGDNRHISSLATAPPTLVVLGWVVITEAEGKDLLLSTVLQGVHGQLCLAFQRIKPLRALKIVGTQKHPPTRKESPWPPESLGRSLASRSIRQKLVGSIKVGGSRNRRYMRTCFYFEISRRKSARGTSRV